MSRRAKYTIEQKIRAAERYIKGDASAASIAAELGMTKTGERQIMEWAAIYREKGIEGFHIGEGNEKHTAEKKKHAVEEYLHGQGSHRDICRKYHIPSTRLLILPVLFHSSSATGSAVPGQGLCGIQAVSGVHKIHA